jgi:hypothetical protein
MRSARNYRPRLARLRVNRLPAQTRTAVDPRKRLPHTRGDARSTVIANDSPHRCFAGAALLTLTLCLVACASKQPQTAKVVTTDTTEDHPWQPSLACTIDAECPSGQRCGFQGKLISKCIVDSHSAACIPPGGSCGCDGRPVERICDAGTRTVYTSAPACFVGPCPKMCNDKISCPPSLTCQNGQCGKP